MKTLLAASLLALLLSACSDKQPSQTSPAEQKTVEPAYREGIHYLLLNKPLPQADTRNIVTEFFWYGCSHCKSFEPVLKQWDAQKKPFNTLVQKSPAIWSEPMRLHAKLFYIAESMNIKAQAVHADLYNSVAAAGREKDLDKQRAHFAKVFAKHGMPAAEFERQLQSATITQQVEQAEQRMKQAQIRSTPTIVVNGKYQIQNKAVKSMREVLDIASALIERGETQ